MQLETSHSRASASSDLQLTLLIKLLQGSSWAGDLLMSIIGLPMDSPHPQAEGHCGSLWPRTQSTLQRHVPPLGQSVKQLLVGRVRYAGLVANLTLVRVTQHQGCMIQIVWCVAPFRQEALEGDTLQLTTQLFPALCALCPNRLGVFAVSQLGHLPVPPCCALVDWPVGTPFTVYAYNDLQAARAVQLRVLRRQYSELLLRMQTYA